jgi:hypothetical protein
MHEWQAIFLFGAGLGWFAHLACWAVLNAWIRRTK